MDFSPLLLLVTCDSCGKSTETLNGADPDSALECDCCPYLHNHAGRGCRTITINGTARLTMFDINDIMEAIGGEAIPSPELVDEKVIMSFISGTEAEVLFANGFAYPVANSVSTSAQFLMNGVSGKFQQPYFQGGFFQQSRSGQVAKAEFTATLAGQSTATTAVITAYLGTSPGIAGFPGSVLATTPTFTVTNFTASTFHGEVLISCFGSGYGTSSISTNLQSTMDCRYFNATGTSGVLVAGPTALQTIDFSVNQWLQLGVAFSTTNATNATTLQQVVLYGLDLGGFLMSMITGSQSEVLFANGFAYPVANASSTSSQALITGASAKYGQPYFPGGYLQQSRSGQVAAVEFAIILAGQAAATTAIFTAGLATAANSSGNTLVAANPISCTSFSGGTVHGRVLISNFGSGYSLVNSTNLWSTISLIANNGSTTGGVAAAGGPTELFPSSGGVDFSANQWLYLTVTFSTSSTSNSAQLQQLVLFGLNLPRIKSI